MRSEAACEASARARKEVSLETDASVEDGFENVIEAVENAKKVTLADVTASSEPVVEKEPAHNPHLDPETDLEAMRASLLAKLNSTGT